MKGGVGLRMKTLNAIHSCLCEHQIAMRLQQVALARTMTPAVEALETAVAATMIQVCLFVLHNRPAAMAHSCWSSVCDKKCLHMVHDSLALRNYLKCSDQVRWIEVQSILGEPD